MSANSLPVYVFRILMPAVQAARHRPAQSKLVLVKSSRNVRMAPRFYVWIDANRNAGQIRRARSSSPCFLQQNFQLRLRFNIELQYPRVGFLVSFVSQRLPYFFARFAHPGKYDPVAENTNVAEVIELPSGDNVEPTTL